MFLEKFTNIENFHNLPSNVYLKSLSGINLYCNDYQAKSAGMSKADDAINVNCNDHLENAMSAIVRKNDEEIIKTNKIAVIFENAVIGAQKCTYLSYKMPLIIKKKRLACLLGLSIPLGDIKKLSGKSISTDVIKPLDYIRNIIQQHEFSKIEEECLYYFICGIPLEKIASQLSMISTKTVEYYLDKIKDQYNCTTRAELIVKIILNHHR